MTVEKISWSISTKECLPDRSRELTPSWSPVERASNWATEPTSEVYVYIYVWRSWVGERVHIVYGQDLIDVSVGVTVFCQHGISWTSERILFKTFGVHYRDIRFRHLFRGGRAFVIPRLSRKARGNGNDRRGSVVRASVRPSHSFVRPSHSSGRNCSHAIFTQLSQNDFAPSAAARFVRLLQFDCFLKELSPFV